MKRGTESALTDFTFPGRLASQLARDLAAARRDGHPGCRQSWHLGYQAGFSDGVRTGIKAADDAAKVKA